MKQIKTWNLALSPTSFDIKDSSSKKRFQMYQDLSSILQLCTSTIDYDTTESGILHLVFCQEVRPFIRKLFFSMANKPVTKHFSSEDIQVQFALCVANLVQEDILVQVELQFTDGSYELRTFEDLDVDLDLSCLFIGADMDIINFRALQQNLPRVPFVDSSFLALRYSSVVTETSTNRIPTGYLSDGKPVTSFVYIEHFAEWLERT